MDDSQSEPKPFEIGLVLAGAVSAGAYSAGVMDYLIETLEAWRRAKESDASDNIPRHSVVIKVMTGASAGGMTAAIALAELFRRANNPADAQKPEYESLMYQAWVKRIDITRLLKTVDLKQSNGIKSLLDSTAIDEIANEMIDVTKLPRWQPIPYVDPELKLYLTLSNLRGLPYEFKLRGETGLPYGMTDHSDYQFVMVCEKMTDEDWEKIRNAAIATGAFPVGLASRLIKRDTDEYKTRIYKDGRDISGLLEMCKRGNEPYHFVAVDGGMLNNEPVELAQSVWEKLTDKEKELIHNFEDYKNAQRIARQRAKEKNNYALILIDPFPDLPDIGKDPTEKDTALQKIISPIIGALRAQSLFKLEELMRAADSESKDRYLISPIRYTETGSKALNAIASGFMGGFGGFLAEEFRQHDYLLGRRNAQRFLQGYFRVTPKEAESKGWNVAPDYIFPVKKKESSPSSDTTEPPEYYYPIIPVIKGTPQAKEQGAKNRWPDYYHGRKAALHDGIDKRVKALMQRALPFGWISNVWVTVLLIVLGGLVITGEFIKALQSGCQCHFFVHGLKNSYILIFQIICLILVCCALALRLGKRKLEKNIIHEVKDIFLSQLHSWGIKEKHEK